MNSFLGKSVGATILLVMGAHVGLRPAFAQNGQIALSPNVGPPKLATASELPPQVLAVSDYSAQMRIMQHCNRLVTTRSSVARTFVADPRIAEVVQFRPNELVLIGLQTGRTTVTLWFEESPEPLIYLVEVVNEAVSPARLVGQNARSGEGLQATVDSNRRKQESRVTGARDRQLAPVKPVGADVNSRAPDLAMRRQPGAFPSGGRYDGHAPWPQPDRKSLNGATPIGFDGILAGQVKTAR